MGIHPITALLSALGVLSAVYIAGWARAMAAVRRLTLAAFPATDARLPTADDRDRFVTNFFDALGIGSFATSTALFRCSRWCPTASFPAR